MKELFENQLVQEILKKVLENSIKVELKPCKVKSPNGLGEQIYNSFAIDGFYKSGEANLCRNLSFGNQGKTV